MVLLLKLMQQYVLWEREKHVLRPPGGGVSESMDGRGCAILALDVVPKNLIFA